MAKAAAGDAIWFLATVNRIAEILAARATPIRWGPDGPARSAFGPARGGAAAAHRASAQHTDQPNESTEPAEPDASSEDEPATTSEAKPDAHADDEPDANSDDEPESESRPASG